MKFPSWKDTLQRDSVIDFLKEYEGFHPEIIRRELTVPVDGRHIISVIGPRRAGKTYFLLSLRSSFASPPYTSTSRIPGSAGWASGS
jgi:predicted AAA+ superfamily ATPase